ncbi:MAG: molybdate ABC transporter permease subunit [Actinomycetes bacterium]
MRPPLTRALLGLVFFAAILVAMGFLVLPIVAIFTHVPVTRLIHEFSNPVVTDALVVSLKTIVISQIVILLLGTPTAYFLASRRFPGRSIVVTLVELPIVLPPAVAGLGLIVAFGRYGLLGSTLRFLHIDVSFNQIAVVLAICLVSGPFYIRQAIASFEAVDANLIAASRTLGAGSVRTFFRVTLPLAQGGLAAGEAICMARGLGEFGATIMFAGSLQGRTQTLPLAVYTEFEANIDVALAISALLVVISLAILLSLKATGLWQRARTPLVTGREGA